MLAFCARCELEVDAVHGHPARRKWAKLYFLLPIPFVPILPIMAADFMVSLPMVMIYLLGVGPVLGMLREPPLCGDCGAIVH